MSKSNLTVSPRFPFSIRSGSLKANVSPNAIISDVNWSHAAGKTMAGQTVNSLDIATDGSSVLLKANGGATIGVNASDLEVAAVMFLKSVGYTVSPTPAS